MLGLIRARGGFFTCKSADEVKNPPLALINPSIILIVVVNKLLVSLYFCWCVA
jgi:hypothetical protein